MRVLITGAEGFLGSHVAEALDGHDLLGIDNYETGRRGQAPCEIIEGTIADRGFVLGVFERFRPDVVLHAAATYRDPDAWELAARTNALGTAWVVGAAERFRAKRIVYLQTALCYGPKPTSSPIPIAAGLRPEGAYAVTKTAGEEILRRSGLEWVSLRLANAYGPRNLSGPIPIFTKRISRGEECVVAEARRDFIYVGDLVQLIERALDVGAPSGVFHASSGADVSIVDVFATVVRALGVVEPVWRQVPPGPDDAATILLDPWTTEQAFGWRPETSLWNGISEAVAWYRENEVGETYTHLRFPPEPDLETEGWETVSEAAERGRELQREIEEHPR